MYPLYINWKIIGSYNAIYYSYGSSEWNFSSIIHPTAKIQLQWKDSHFSLWYREKKGFFGFWKKEKFIDVINMETGNIFSFPVSTIFFAKVFENDLKIITKYKESLKFYEYFKESNIKIEPDWYNEELRPFWAYDVFIGYNDNGIYFPLIYNEEILKQTKVKNFYDYDNYKFYVDSNWKQHFVLLIEEQKNTETDEYWYFIDNFKKISERLIFNDETENELYFIENWSIDLDGVIHLSRGNGTNWIINKDGKLIKQH